MTEFHDKPDPPTNPHTYSDSNKDDDSSAPMHQDSSDLDSAKNDSTDRSATSTGSDADVDTEADTEPATITETDTETAADTDTATITETENETGTGTDTEPEKDSDTKPVDATWTWGGEKDLPNAAGALATAVIDGDLHVLGGGSDWYGSVYYQRHLVYNAMNDSWATYPANIPDKGTWGAQAHVYNKKIYLVGGYNEGAKLLRVFDPSNNSWKTLPQIPVPFDYGFVSAVVNKKLYVIGGFDNSSKDGPVYAFDLVNETWQSRAKIPQNQGAGALAGAAVGTKIYVLNGGSAGGTTILQVYNTITNSWSSGTGLNSHFEAAAAVAFKNKVYFFGGAADHDINSPVTVKRAVNIYEPTTDTWTSGPFMPTPRMFASAVVLDGAFHVLGGFDGQTHGVTAHEVLALE